MSSKISKADEIKRAIAAVAGPSGTLPLFPSNKPTNVTAALEDSQKSESKSKDADDSTGSSRSSLELPQTGPKKGKALKPSPFPKVAEKRHNKDTFEIPKLSHSASSSQQTADADSNTFVSPVLKNIKESSKNTQLDDQPVEFSTVKLKRVVYNSHSTKDSEDKEEPAKSSLTFGGEKASSVHKTNEKVKETETETETNTETETEAEGKPALPTATDDKKTDTKAPFLKPKPLPSSKSAGTGPSTRETKINVSDPVAEDDDSHEDFRRIPLRKVVPEPEVEQEEKVVSDSHAKIITPISNSPVPGLRRFQTTREHNTHNQLSSSINGRVPMPGMASSRTSTASRTQSSVPSTPPPPERTRSVLTSSPSIRSGPKFSPSTIDLRASSSLSPAGSFLASRSSTSISIPRQKSPSRGGFVQSAMLRREGTISRPRSDSNSNGNSSSNIFDGIVLANPATAPGTRSPSPFRHSRTQSANNVENIGSSLSQSTFNSKISHSKSVTDVSSTNGFQGDDELHEDETSDTPEKSTLPPSRSSSNLLEERAPLTPQHAGPSLKSSDSRRWSPTRQTWLGNALKKTSQNHGPSFDNTSSVNRASTVKSQSPTRIARGSSFVADKPVFAKPPETPPPRGSHPHKLADHSNNPNDEAETSDQATPSEDTLETKNSSHHELPIPPPSRGKLPIPPAKNDKLFRSSTSISRVKSVKPPVPKKPDFNDSVSSKPELPSDALAKLRALRSGNKNASTPPASGNSSPSKSDNDLEQVKDTLRRANTLQYKASRNGEHKLPPKPLNYRKAHPETLKEDEEESDENDEYRPPLPTRPSVLAAKYEDEGEPPKLPLRRTIVQKNTEPLPPVPDELKNKTQSADSAADAEDPVMEARRVLFGPNATEKAQKEADEKLYNSPHIPAVLNKKTAKSFASDLSAVLQRGKPLVSVNDSNKSFSPSFQGRMAGIKSTPTFDEAETSSQRSFRGRSSDDSIEPDTKVELKHMTKGRAKGPKGRRLPKNVTSNSSPSLNTLKPGPSSRLGAPSFSHQRQRSRSLSPGDVRRATESLSSDNSFQFPKNSSRVGRIVRPKYSFEPESDDEDSIPNAPPSRPASAGTAPLIVPKHRKPLPATPSATLSNDNKQEAIYESVLSRSNTFKPAVRKSSQTVAKNLQRAKESAASAAALKQSVKSQSLEKEFSTDDGLDKVPRKPISRNDTGASTESNSSSKTQPAVARKLVKPIPPPKPRQLSATLK